MKSSFIVNLLAVIVIGLCLTSNAQSPEKFSPRLKKIIEQNGDNVTIKAWVYFADKGSNVQSKLASAETNLTPRSMKRRLRNRGANNLVDFKDIPVNNTYIIEVKSRVQKIRHKSRWLNAVSVEANGNALKQVGQLSIVKRIDIVREGKRKPLPEGEKPKGSQQFQGTQLNYGNSYDQNNQINTIPLHNMGYNGSGVLVCMLDAGFNNLQHEALTNLNILKTWDFVNGDSIVSDEPGQAGTGNHGTLTLSTLAGFKEGQLVGPAYGADFVLAKTENTDWEHNIEEDDWVAGAEWGDSLGADIISSSLGYRDFDPGQNSYTWQDMDGNTAVSTIGADVAASRGILVVNSAGNEGSAIFPENSLIAPSDGDSVCCVGAVNSSGNRASFSSMGPTADGRTKPDVMARGVGTVCASPYNPTGYTTASGTSLSCPLVAGAAALVLQVNPTWTNMQILDALRNTADNASNPSNTYGWGVINTYEAAFYSFTGVADGPKPIENFDLYPAYPNPFNPSTNIRFSLSSPGQVDLAIYNNLGQKVATLVDKQMNLGEHKMNWDASGFASGVYYMMLKANEGQRIQKLLLIK
jgi:serine protease AprX